MVRRNAIAPSAAQRHSDTGAQMQAKRKHVNNAMRSPVEFERQQGQKSRERPDKAGLFNNQKRYETENPFNLSAHRASPPVYLAAYDGLKALSRDP